MLIQSLSTIKDDIIIGYCYITVPLLTDLICHPSSDTYHTHPEVTWSKGDNSFAKR